MNFHKDILLIDTEFSGFDLEKHELLQVAAILLDKKTLKEKKFFNSYIKPKNWPKRDKDSMKVNGITWEMVKDAPGLKEAIKSFKKEFGENVIQAFYVGFNDKRFMLEAYKKAGIKWEFDYHFLDIWALAYAYLGKKNLLKSKNDFAGFGLEYLMKHFKIEVPKAMHDALVDCRVEAEIFRYIIKAL